MKRAFALMVVVCSAVGVGVGAQTRFHCRDSNGNSFVLSRPCPSDTRTTAAVAEAVPSYQSSYSRSSPATVRVQPEAPSHHQYMSARCRSLDDNIRSAIHAASQPTWWQACAVNMSETAVSRRVMPIRRFPPNAAAATRSVGRKKIGPTGGAGIPGAGSAFRPAMRRIAPHPARQACADRPHGR